MNTVFQFGKILVLISFLGLVVACTDHPHEEDPGEKKGHTHSHSET